ncbi:MAG: NUDIX hydrolase [Candidatus Nanopelagicales bacterium]|nr:NUDIX hydrolase [Candidatus Nanopelagicales bacterium]
MRQEIHDLFAPQPVVERWERFDGRCWAVRSDEVSLPSGETVVRDYVVHPGAVGIAALDDRDRMLLINQYRHPVGSYLWEAPAGLLDKPGEDPLAAAKRELIEEAGLVADSWAVLLDYLNSPGGSSESFRCYLARGLRPAPDGRPVGEAEEADMPARWVDLDEALALVQGGQLQNPTAVMGVLACHAARRAGWTGLRPADAPWPVRDGLTESGRVFAG